jgi:hypothetical protein
LCKFYDLLPIKLALMHFSGIITTILGETATFPEDSGRDIRVHHSKSLPLSFTGERLFFSLDFHSKYSLKYLLKHIHRAIMMSLRTQLHRRDCAHDSGRSGDIQGWSQCSGVLKS